MARILIIDDHGVMRDSLKEVLSQRGHEVWAAADGPSGLRIAKTCDPQIVILDRDLPGMTGSQVLPVLRRSHPTARVIILTAFTGSKTASRYRDSGADSFLSKGTDLAGLFREIDRLLDGRKAR